VRNRWMTSLVKESKASGDDSTAFPDVLPAFRNVPKDHCRAKAGSCDQAGSGIHPATISGVLSAAIQGSLTAK
jgi:hypothetical protein